RRHADAALAAGRAAVAGDVGRRVAGLAVLRGIGHAEPTRRVTGVALRARLRLVQAGGARGGGRDLHGAIRIVGLQVRGAGPLEEVSGAIQDLVRDGPEDLDDAGVLAGRDLIAIGARGHLHGVAVRVRRLE